MDNLNNISKFGCRNEVHFEFLISNVGVHFEFLISNVGVHFEFLISNFEIRNPQFEMLFRNALPFFLECIDCVDACSNPPQLFKFYKQPRRTQRTCLISNVGVHFGRLNTFRNSNCPSTRSIVLLNSNFAIQNPKCFPKSSTQRHSRCTPK